MPNCELCGEPMPPGEEVFKYHGYSGACPKPPLPRPPIPTQDAKTINKLGFAAFCADAVNAGSDLNQAELLRLWEMSHEEVRARWRCIADAVLMVSSAHAATP